MEWRVPSRDRLLHFPRRPLIMGIVNLNADSFSGDGHGVEDMDAALNHARQLVADGADIIDVGAETARTNREAMPPAEEIAPLRQFIARFEAEIAGWPARWDEAQVDPPLLSVNSWRDEVWEALADLPFDLMNDMSGLIESTRPAEIARDHGKSLLIMHIQGRPKVAHEEGLAEVDAAEAVRDFLRGKLELAVTHGLAADQIILDPGLGFAKRPEQDLQILRRFEELAAVNRPVLAPVSRKGFIGAVLGQPDPAQRDAGTVAASVSAIMRGASIVRVHHVAAVARSVKVVWGIGLTRAYQEPA